MTIIKANGAELNTDNFIFDSQTGVQRSRDERKYVEENKHLALQFPIKELRHYFHATFPGRWTLVHAQSHNFKTQWVDFWAKVSAVDLAEQMEQNKQKRGVVIKISTEDAIEGLVESQIASFGGGELDDIALGIIKNPQDFVRAETIVGGLPIVHIGESLGMDDSNAALLTLSNIARLIDYVRKDHFGEYTPIAAIFADYLQAFPFDTEVSGARNMTDSRTLQINRDTDTFRRMVKYFSCPGVMTAQSNPDKEMSTINDPIKLPGYWDTHWSKYPPQRADFMYTLWMPKSHYKLGEWVDGERTTKDKPSRWNFEVKNDALWIGSRKHKKFKNVGASFPLKVDTYGNVSLNSPEYERIQKLVS